MFRTLLLAAIASTAIAAIPSLASATSAPPTLIDQHGHAFTLAQLKGVPLVITFISTHCTDVCPLIDAQTADAVRQVRKEHLAVRFLTITLDPAHDTLRDMQHLAHVFGAHPARWIVAGGSPANVHAVMRAFYVWTDKRAARAHTTFVYFADKSGIVRKTILAGNDLSGQIVQTLRQSWSVLDQ